MPVAKYGSLLLATIEAGQLIDFIGARVPAMALAIQIGDEDGGIMTTSHNLGMRPLVVGLADLAYHQARGRSLVIMTASEEDIPEPTLGADDHDTSRTVDDYTVEELCDYLKDHPDVRAIAMGISIPEDGGQVTTYTYLSGNAATCRGLADLNLEVAQMNCRQSQAPKENAADEVEDEDDNA